MDNNSVVEKCVAISLLLTMVFMLSGCNEKENITVVQETSQEITQQSEDTLNQRYVEPIFDIAKTENIEFAEVTNVENETIKLMLDVYQPTSDLLEKRPVVIWVHGGGFSAGSKDMGIETNMAMDLAKRGYVSICINYRLRKYPFNDFVGTLEDAMEDVTMAYQWVLNNYEEYGLDVENIAFAGVSAGGGILINLLYGNSLENYSIDKSKVFAVIDLSGGEFIYGMPQETDPSCLVVHGTEDNVVPISKSKNFVKKLDRKGVNNVFYTLEGVQHNLSVDYDEVLDVITKFMYENLVGKEIDIAVRTFTEIDYKETYVAKQIHLVVDGKLDEWTGSNSFMLNKKGEGCNNIPDPDDFSGEMMIGWNEMDPTRVYFAGRIKDDLFVTDSKPVDSLQIMLDITDSMDQELNSRLNIYNWILSVTGELPYYDSDSNGLEFAVLKEGDQYYYEAAIDISKVDIQDSSGASLNFNAKDGKSIGVNIGYIDAENSEAKQINWNEGGFWDCYNFGQVVFNLTKVEDE